MTLDIQNLRSSFEGKERVALDEGAAKQINHSLEEARTQFTAAVENLIRTEKGENTVAGGSASITSFGGTSKHSVFNAARDLINSFVGTSQSQTLVADKGRGR